MKIKTGYIPITREVQEFIKSEIERTGIGPQRILKGNLQAKKIGLTSGTIYRIIGKNGIAKTAKKTDIDLITGLWENTASKQDCKSHN